MGTSRVNTPPKHCKKAREEIDSVIGTTRLVEESYITIIPHIQAIIKKTLRLRPPSLFIPRESSQKCTINGYGILVIIMWLTTQTIKKIKTENINHQDTELLSRFSNKFAYIPMDSPQAIRFALS